MPELKDQALPSIEILGQEILQHTEDLARCSQEPDCLTRRFATPEHRAAAGLIESWMQEAGMETHLDAAGNVVGRYEGVESDLPVLMFGSHQDTVRNAGKYDGMLGIVTPIACVKALHQRGERLSFAIEIVAFGDEEGVRYQTTLFGSRAIAGTFDMQVLERRDADGISVREALHAFDLDPETIPSLARKPEEVLAFVELHIEQGPVLEAKELPVGVVTAIAGGARLMIEVKGEAGHAGTVPMARRRDALTAAAECILAIERYCAEAASLVGTVGTVQVEPGAINVIPGNVRFSIDVRAPENDARRDAVQAICTEIEAICARRGVAVEINRIYEADGRACTPWIMDQLDRAVAAEGIAPYRLFSGAGHDAMAMAELTDIGMLFVRCERGISHSPEEAITAEDAGVGARVLLRFIRNFQRP